jgi:hypothetical protein
MRSRRARRIGFAIAALHAIALLAALAGIAGCRPMLAAESSAPPGRAARLDEVTSWFWGVKSYRLALSQGVALAVSCTRGGPCEKLLATSDDPAIAEVRPASLTALRPAGYTGNQQPPAAVVIVGKVPGATTIRLRSSDGDREIRVTVVAPPAPSTATAIAR